MRITDLDGKSVCLLGFGKEGHSALQAMRRFAPRASITIADKNSATDVPPGTPAQLGDDWLRDLGRFDVLLKSPGIPPLPELASMRDRMTTPTQIFLDTIADAGATVIGVTGSKGKSTTSSLIAAILQACGRNTVFAGNIGRPALDFLEKITADCIVVLEMSSYQLMDVTRSPHIAVLTSFFPEHLDYHGSLEAYRDAKAHIARFQTPDDILLYPSEVPDAAAIANESRGKKFAFSSADAPVRLEEMRLRGVHNLSNIAAAWKLVELLDLPHAAALHAIKTFAGLPHRLQVLATNDGITWVDDAISTTPESTVAAINAFGDAVATLILGGQDRGYDFNGLAERVRASQVRTIILFPGSGKRIREALENAGVSAQLFDAPSMPDAVRIAKEETPKGGLCLLSPASPSYGMFKNFEERGNAFAQEIGIRTS